jgi:Fe2+ or Zn2+ uptake regulation protein
MTPVNPPQAKNRFLTRQRRLVLEILRQSPHHPMPA